MTTTTTPRDHQPAHHSQHPSGPRPRPGRHGRRPGLLAAGAMAAAPAVSGCSTLPDSWSVTHQVDVVSGEQATEVGVEYLTRQTGLSQAQTTAAVVPPGAAPWQAEAIGPTGEEVSVSAEGAPGLVLGCAVLLDGERVIAEAESTTPGEGVECTATTPASLED